MIYVRKLNVSNLRKMKICPLQAYYHYKSDHTKGTKKPKTKDMIIGDLIHEVFGNAEDSTSFEKEINRIEKEMYGKEAVQIIKNAKYTKKHFIDSIENYDSLIEQEVCGEILGVEIVGVLDRIFNFPQYTEVLEIKKKKPKTSENKKSYEFQLKTYLYLLELIDVKAEGKFFYLEKDRMEMIRLNDDDREDIEKSVGDLVSLIIDPHDFNTLKKREDFCKITKCKYRNICGTIIW